MSKFIPNLIPDMVQINHDLNFLYCIARTQLPRDILETLMYGEDFEEPLEEDIEEIKNIIKNNEKNVQIEEDAYDNYYDDLQL